MRGEEEDVGGGLGGGLPQGGDGQGGKDKWWPSCFHSKMSKLAVRKFQNRIVILWKCRRCPKRVTETIDVDMNSRKVFVKSTISQLPRSDESSNE
jgi:hypothetical protein